MVLMFASSHTIINRFQTCSDIRFYESTTKCKKLQLRQRSWYVGLLSTPALFPILFDWYNRACVVRHRCHTLAWHHIPRREAYQYKMRGQCPQDAWSVDQRWAWQRWMPNQGSQRFLAPCTETTIYPTCCISLLQTSLFSCNQQTTILTSNSPVL